MPTNQAEFDRQMQISADLMVRRGTEFFHAVATKAYQFLTTDSRAVGLSYGSPVASGRFASSWRVSVNGIDGGVTPADPTFKWSLDAKRTIPNPAISLASNTIRRARLGDVINITNSLPYSRVLEFGGSATKAPKGVLQITIDVVVTNFRSLNVGRDVLRRGFRT